MKDYQYYGLFLDIDTKNMLMDTLTDNIDYNIALGVADRIFIDHCTLLHKSQSSTPSGHPLMCLLNSLLKKGDIKHNIIINAIGISKKAMAFRVIFPKKSRVSSLNEMPHITICTFNGGKPVESNNITNWKYIEPITIYARLEKR